MMNTGDFKIGDRVRVVSLMGTGLEGTDFLGKEGFVQAFIADGNRANALDVDVKLENEYFNYSFAPRHLEHV